MENENLNNEELNNEELNNEELNNEELNSEKLSQIAGGVSVPGEKPAIMEGRKRIEGDCSVCGEHFVTYYRLGAIPKGELMCRSCIAKEAFKDLRLREEEEEKMYRMMGIERPKRPKIICSSKIDNYKL